EIAQAHEDLRADALHMLGRIHEATGDNAAMATAWLEVRKLDQAAEPGPLKVSEDDVEKIAAEALDELPAKVREKLEEGPLMIDDVPSEELVKDGVDPRVLGLFQGTPMPEDGGQAGEVTHILLFRGNL